ncbi:rhodanese-like domain-containing protein [Thauera sp. 2A1]|uniref:rhodanese-like domain-containing protein n=1 Tax=Thauera sp. 2A1 TaxID=2570191 RepID=UPI001292751B|nr:rhodanese-like domain-containing protein [Thauera sp. 2A1]KAI5916765.1 rhodanese-like domain-containing protein [Thauera sp. 2A1]
MEFLQQNWYWAALAAASGAWLLVDLARSQGDKSMLSPVEATLLINREDAIVIDVREQGEYAQGHIPNARHVPLGEISRRAGELDKFKGRPVILCCASGTRSASALSQLKKAGFEKLYNLRGGLAEWEKAGQPITRKRK